MVWYSHLFKFPWFAMIHTFYCFGIIHETEVVAFLKFPCFHYDPADVGNLITGSSAFSNPSLNIWKFLACIMQKPSMQDFKHDLTSMGDELNCLMVTTFFSTTFPGNWDEGWPFPVLWPLLSLPDLLTYWVQHLIASSFRVLNSSTGIPSHPLALLTAELLKAHLPLNIK